MDSNTGGRKSSSPVPKGQYARSSTSQEQRGDLRRPTSRNSTGRGQSPEHRDQRRGGSPSRTGPTTADGVFLENAGLDEEEQNSGMESEGQRGPQIAGKEMARTPNGYERFQFDLLDENVDDSFSTANSFAYNGRPTPHPERPRSALNTYPYEDTPYSNMGLKQREKIIDELKKENFGLKLRIYFLEENLEKTSPEWMQRITKEYEDQKGYIESLRAELENTQKEFEMSVVEGEKMKAEANELAEGYERLRMDKDDLLSELDTLRSTHVPKEELESVQEENANLLRDIQQLRDHLDENRKAAKAAKASEEAVRREQEDETGRLASMIKSKNIEITRLNAELEASTKELEMAHEALAGREMDKKRMYGDLRQSIEEELDKQFQVTMEDRIKAIREEEERKYKAKLATLQTTSPSDIARLRSELETARRAVKQSEEKYQTEIRGMAEQLDVERRSNRQLRGQVEESVREASALRNNYEEMRETCHVLEEENERLAAQLEGVPNSGEDAQELLKELTSLKHLLEEEQQQRRTLQQLLKDKDGELTHWIAKVNGSYGDLKASEIEWKKKLDAKERELEEMVEKWRLISAEKSGQDGMISQLRQQKKELLDELEEMRGHYEDKVVELKDRATDLEQLERQLEDMQAAQANVDKKFEKEVAKYKEEVAEIKKVINLFPLLPSSRLSEANGEIRDLTAQLMENHRSHQEDEMNSLATIQRLQTELESVKAESLLSREKLTKAESLLTMKTRDSTDLASKLKSLNTQLQERNETVHLLQDQLSQCEQNLQAYKSFSLKTEQEASSLRQSVTQLNSQLNAKTHELDELDARWRRDSQVERDRLVKMEKEVSTLKDEKTKWAKQEELIGQLVRDLEVARDRCEKMEDDARNMTVMVEHTRAEAETLKMENRNVLKNLGDSQTELVRAHELLQVKNQETEGIQETLEQLRTENRKLLEQVRSFGTIKAKLEERVFKREQELEEAHRKYGAAWSRIEDLQQRLSSKQVVEAKQQKQFQDENREYRHCLERMLTQIDTMLRNSKQADATGKYKYPRDLIDAVSARLFELQKTRNYFQTKSDELRLQLDRDSLHWTTQFEKMKAKIRSYEPIIKGAKLTQARYREERDESRRKLGEEKTHSMRLLEKIRNLESDIQREKQNAEQARAELRDAKEALDQYQNKRNRTSEGGFGIDDDGERAAKRILELEKDLNAARDRAVIERRGAEERVNELLRNTRKLEHELETITRNYQQLQQRVQPESEYAAQRKLVHDLEAQLEGVKQDLHTTKADFAVLRMECINLIADREKLRKSLSKRNAQIAESLSQLDIFNNRKETLEYAILKKAQDEVRAYLDRNRTEVDYRCQMTAERAATMKRMLGVHTFFSITTDDGTGESPTTFIGHAGQALAAVAAASSSPQRNGSIQRRFELLAAASPNRIVEIDRHSPTLGRQSPTMGRNLGKHNPVMSPSRFLSRRKGSMDSSS
ncbi:hypothetical protein HK102_002115 [Quaeritorhiza haematococci]|nr:hypothetical protein HK102_002115 [Quaeritorhiza haematococci]